MELYIYHAIKIQVDGVEVNAYLGYMDALLAKTGADGFDGITSWEKHYTQGSVLVHWMGVSRGNRNDYPYSSSWMRIELSLSTS